MIRISSTRHDLNETNWLFIIHCRPIVGVLTLPNSMTKDKSYFPASYVKWLESGGVRVAPIPYDIAPSQLTTLLKQLNGALFTGGGACEARMARVASVAAHREYRQENETLTLIFCMCLLSLPFIGGMQPSSPRRAT